MAQEYLVCHHLNGSSCLGHLLESHGINPMCVTEKWKQNCYVEQAFAAAQSEAESSHRPEVRVQKMINPWIVSLKLSIFWLFEENKDPWKAKWANSKKTTPVLQVQNISPVLPWKL